MKIRTAIAAVALAAIAPHMPCCAQVASAVSDTESRLTALRALTKEDVDTWLDGLLPYAIHNGDIAGGVVIVVKDGQVLTERGFGYADVARQKPMDPRLTLIRPGSVSKLLTWTAVLQLVEREALDLDTDVNRYLDFVIPPLDRKPITLRNIMTHTSGFEESLKDLDANAPPAPLADYVKLHLPLRIYLPGQVPAYSNYATALAGYIVQRVSHQLFDEYVDRHILAPLGMSHSSFRQPLPPDLRGLVSDGYTVASKPPGYYEYFGPAPAGSMATTADDMGRFMLAHLQNGRYGDVRILSEQTAILMHAVQPRIYPALNGMALGFYEASRNGHRIIAHNGGTQFFHSDLHLFLEDGAGLFISLNSAGEQDAATRLLDGVFHGFADRYFPAASRNDSPRISLDTARDHARLMAGMWEDSRRSTSTLLSIAGFLNTMAISANDDGTINVPVPSKGTMLFHETAPFVWMSGSERIQALVSKGRPVILGFGMAPPAAFLPQSRQRSAAWLNPALALALAVLALTVVSWAAAAIARRTYKVPFHVSGRQALLYTMTRASALAVLLTTIMFGFTLVYLSSDLARMSNASDGWVLALQAAALIVFPGATLVSVWNLLCARIQGRTWLARAGSIAFLASCCVMLWAAVEFHLMALRTNY
jgi:CubicO group peptidase (beta-lactamase class C family)